MFSMARLNRVDEACGPCSPWRVSTVLMRLVGHVLHGASQPC